MKIQNSTRTAHSKNGKTLHIENGSVREISYGDENTFSARWENVLDYENYILGNTIGTKGRSKVFKGRKCVFIGTVAEVDELDSIGRFI